ncbi:uncharacterized protein METZ01_LOCUS377972 [marine metagenome]|uniref:Uncharacterized protein n=1 Tax=marine metagenome TaxID=408172 RepID=A0A382TUI2_9ZZZZ
MLPLTRKGFNAGCGADVDGLRRSCV